MQRDAERPRSDVSGRQAVGPAVHDDVHPIRDSGIRADMRPAISRRPGTPECVQSFAAQVGNSFDAAAGTRLILRAYDLERLGEQQFASRSRERALKAQSDGRLAAPDGSR